MAAVCADARYPISAANLRRVLLAGDLVSSGNMAEQMTARTMVQTGCSAMARAWDGGCATVAKALALGCRCLSGRQRAAACPVREEGSCRVLGPNRSWRCQMQIAWHIRGGRLGTTSLATWRSSDRRIGGHWPGVRPDLSSQQRIGSLRLTAVCCSHGSPYQKQNATVTDRRCLGLRSIGVRLNAVRFRVQEGHLPPLVDSVLTGSRAASC